MLADVIEVKALQNYQLQVRFEDGLIGIVDMSQDRFEGVFAPLKDPDFFSHVTIENGVVTWPNGVDLAPDTMYEEIKRSGKWVL